MRWFFSSTVFTNSFYPQISFQQLSYVFACSVRSQVFKHQWLFQQRLFGGFRPVQFRVYLGLILGAVKLVCASKYRWELLPIVLIRQTLTKRKRTKCYKNVSGRHLQRLNRETKNSHVEDIVIDSFIHSKEFNINSNLVGSRSSLLPLPVTTMTLPPAWRPALWYLLCL